MITLITGTPGAGKTAWLINQLLQLQINQPHRRLLAHGIKQFKLSHIEIYCRSDRCEICRDKEKPDDAMYLEEWHHWQKPNDLIIADEVQRVWRSKVQTAVMDSIDMLDTHRHNGIDFWLITQSTKLLHSDVRQFVSRHIHLVSKWSGRKEYEWPEVQENTGSVIGAVERPYKLPKQVYKFYKSAEVHTKQDKRKPISFYATIFALCLAVFMVGFAGYRINKRITPPTPLITDAGGVGAAVADTAPPASGNVVDVNKVSFPDFEPKISGVPESAPAYASLVKVVAVPIMMGCVLSKKTDDCKCYTAQATLYPTSKAYCMETIANHRFNPYLEHKKSEPKPEEVAKNDISG